MTSNPIKNKKIGKVKVFTYCSTRTRSSLQSYRRFQQVLMIFSLFKNCALVRQYLYQNYFFFHDSLQDILEFNLNLDLLYHFQNLIKGFRME
jgi:hypothetical protein